MTRRTAHVGGPPTARRPSPASFSVAIGLVLGLCLLLGASTQARALDVAGASSLSQRLSLGQNHSAAIDEDGNLWTWGQSSYKQLGHPDVGSYYESLPGKVEEVASTFHAVSLGVAHSAAIDGDGNLWTWGGSNESLLGHPVNEEHSSYAAPDKVKGIGSKVVAVSVGYALYNNKGCSAAIDENGGLWTWGTNDNGWLGRPVDDGSGGAPGKVVGIGSKVVAVSMGAYNGAAIDENGDLWTWGESSYGQLGRSSESSKSSYDAEPGKVTGIPSKVVAVSVGREHSAAIDEDGNLWTWGQNDGGQLGCSDVEGYSETPVMVKGIDGRIVAVSLGGSHSAAVDECGNLWTWGANGLGQLGYDTESVPVETPRKVEGIDAKVVAVSLGSMTSAAIDEDGHLWTWGTNDRLQLGYDSEYRITNPEPGMVSAFPGFGSQVSNNQEGSEPPSGVATHIVTFDVKGRGTAPDSQTVANGEEVTEPADPSASGYTFGGWYTDSDCTEPYDFSSAVTGDLTLYAKWTEDSGGGNGGGVGSGGGSGGDGIEGGDEGAAPGGGDNGSGNGNDEPSAGTPAKPNPGFVGWNDTGVGTASELMQAIQSAESGTAFGVVLPSEGNAITFSATAPVPEGVTVTGAVLGFPEAAAEGTTTTTYNPEAATFTLSATASPGYDFASWTSAGEAVSTENPWTVTMAAAGAEALSASDDTNAPEAIEPEQVAAGAYVAAFAGAEPEPEPEAPATVAVYRLYNRWSTTHLYTSDLNEKAALQQKGWNVDNKNQPLWYAPKAQGAGDTVILRFWNPYTDDHYFCPATDAAQIAQLTRNGWRQDSSASNIVSASSSTGQAVSTLFNVYNKVDIHLYTTDANEVAALVAGGGWRQETTVIYGVPQA